MTATPTTSETSALLEFLFRLGQALIACGEQTAKIELTLRRIATTYGIRRSRVVVFPTAVFIAIYEGEHERVTLAEGPTQSLRLDQIADVYELASQAQAAPVPPHDGLSRLTAILKKPARFGRVGGVGGHLILTLGLGIVLGPTFTDLIAAVFLGGLVGVLKLVNRDRPVLAVPMPVVAATLVSALTYVAIKQGLPLDATRVLVPPLVSFLPGAMLTLGMVEMAYGDMVSGSSRLMTGFVQLILLAFGLAAGAMLIGIGPEQFLDYSLATPDLVPWPPWVGVLVFTLGVYVHFSAPKRSLGWMLLVVATAFLSQRAGAWLINNDEASGFFGMLIATPLGYLIQLRFKGPPAMVTFLPSFWLLVPGALSLVSVTRMLSDRSAGIDGLTSAMFVLASLALGTLMGASLYKSLTERFDWWQLQIGRAGRYFRK